MSDNKNNTLILENVVPLEQSLGRAFEDPLNERFMQDLYNMSQLFKVALDLASLKSATDTTDENKRKQLEEARKRYDTFNNEFQEKLRNIRSSFIKDEKLQSSLKQYKDYFFSVCDMLSQLKKFDGMDELYLSEQELLKVQSTKKVSEQFVLLFEKVLRDSKLLSNSNITLTDRIESFKKLNDHYRRENETLKHRVEQLEKQVQNSSDNSGGGGDLLNGDVLEFRNLYEKRLSLLEQDLRERDEETRQLRIQLLDLKQRVYNNSPLSPESSDGHIYTTTVTSLDQIRTESTDSPTSIKRPRNFAKRTVERLVSSNENREHSLTPTELKFNTLADNVEENMRKAREMLSVLWADVNSQEDNMTVNNLEEEVIQLE
jgi:hypothetical protein